MKTNATTSRYVGTKMHTKLIYTSVKANIAKLCYVVAKMMSNLNSPTVISVQTNATKSCCFISRMITNFNIKTIVAVEIS